MLLTQANLDDRPGRLAAERLAGQISAGVDVLLEVISDPNTR